MFVAVVVVGGGTGKLEPDKIELGLNALMPSFSPGSLLCSKV